MIFLIKRFKVPALIQNQEINPSFETDKEIAEINKKHLW